MPKHAERIPIIQIRELRKCYSVGQNVVEALKHADLDIYEGDSVAIMGPSGSGKSTLLHLLGCLDSPTSGSYILNKNDISQVEDNVLAEIRARNIGFVFQSFNLIPQLNVYENVEVPFLYQKKPFPDNLSQIIEESLNKVGLSHRLFHHPSELSGGEMQRVAIARALATDPLLILADEPTGNLDSENGKAILKLFSHLNQQGVTIIIVTHDPFVASHCQRLLRMKDGHIVEDLLQWN